MRRFRNYLHAFVNRWHLSLFEKVIVVNSVMLIGEALTALWITSHSLEAHHYLIDTGFIVLATFLTFIVNYILLRASFSPLFHLLSTIREISGGNIQVRAKTYTSDPELNELALAFNTMLNRLEDASREQTNLILQTQEEAQRRIALELHDEVGQNMTALLIHTEVLKQTMQTLLPVTIKSETQQQLTAELEQLTRLTQTTTESIRVIAQQLRPSVLDDLGLLAAFRWLVEDSRQRLHLNATLTTRGFQNSSTLPTQYETTLFRITQESLTNVARHAHAEQVTILLAQEGQQIELSIEDDGYGYEQEKADLAQYATIDRDHLNQTMPKVSKGFALGILGMRERARLLGGTLEIHAQPDHGTIVHATFPCPEIQDMHAIPSQKSDLTARGIKKDGNRK